MDNVKQATGGKTVDQHSIRSGSDCDGDQRRNVDHHNMWMPRTPNTKLQGGIKVAKQITPSLILPKYARANSSPKTPQSNLFRTPPTPKTTPKYRPKGYCRRSLSQSFTTPVSPLLKNPPPIMSSTVYTPVKNPHLPWGENIYCYHCGGTVNLLQSSRIMEHLSKLTIKDIGRTVFDLEKLSDTGMASKCIYSLENSDSDNIMFCDGNNFLEDISKPTTSKSLEACPIANRDKQDTTTTNKRKPKKPTDNWEDTLYSITTDSNDPWPPLSSLDVLDVEEMLKLLDTSLDGATANIMQPDVPSNISVKSNKENTSLDDDATANAPQPTAPSLSVESDKKKIPSPIPKRQLRPRK
ncbi:uncharacterized protein LOC135346978 [Halichondria panicea]|uniref:uncharacterized protein LOC135346978 n=1 Tax=Halichondria panicea TaxID=6063 RepID=UPI00312B7F59